MDKVEEISQKVQQKEQSKLREQTQRNNPTKFSRT